MRIIFLVFLSLLVCNTVFAELVVVLDGTEPKGTLEVSARTKKDWSDHTLIPVGEEYRGKQHYEIKYEGDKLRLATKSEIDAYLQEQEQEQETRKKQDAMNILGITAKHLKKLKEL